jgi:3',5'-cyclic AMP phosphodiesterase CpdA
LRLAHLSDVHVSTFDGAKWSDFLGKRVFGGWHLLFGRSDYLGDKADRLLSAIGRDISELAPDAVIITGDLTSLALPREFEKARAWVETLGPPARVMVLPGNHDYYTDEAAKSRRFETFFADYLGGAEDPYPVVKRLGGVALIGLSSAISTAPHLATGRVGEAQRKKTAALLGEPDIRERFLVLALHHPPDPRFQKGRGRFRGLADTQEILALCAEHKVRMILHGHEHGGTRYEVVDPGRGWRCEVFDAGSATAISNDRHRQARYNVYTFDPERPRLIGARVRVYDAAADKFTDEGMPRLHPVIAG